MAPESCLSESCHQFDDELVLLADFGHGAGAVEVSLVVDADVGGEGLEQAERQAAGGAVTAVVGDGDGGKVDLGLVGYDRSEPAVDREAGVADLETVEIVVGLILPLGADGAVEAGRAIDSGLGNRLPLGGFGLLRHGRTGRDDGGGKYYERWKNDV